MRTDHEEETQLCVWGNNLFSQLAFENPNNDTVVSIPKLLSFEIQISEITCGFNHSLFRTIEGKIFSVGNNSKGQLGIESKVKRRTALTLVSFPDPNEKVLLAASQGNHNLVYTEYGRIYSWGDNSRGQLGTGNLTPAFTPANISANFDIREEDSVVALSCGKFHSMMLLTSGISWAWGANSSWQLGVLVNTQDDLLLPKPCMVNRAQAIAAGYAHSLWKDTSGDLWGVGENEKGELSLKNKFYKIPVKIDIGEKIKKIYATNFSAAITEKDTLFVWGEFMGTVLPITSPFEEENSFGSLPPNLKASGKLRKIKPRISIAGLGENFIVAASELGDCYSWGMNDNGQLGHLLPDEPVELPNEISPKVIEILEAFDIKGISVGPNFVITMVNRKLVEHMEVRTFEGVRNSKDLRTETKLSRDTLEYISNEKEAMGYRESQGHKEDFIQIKSYEKKEVERPKAQRGKADDFLEIARVLVFLYESLKVQLIEIIDSNMDIETDLSAETVQLIKAQQDIIESFLQKFDLKRKLNIELDEKNLLMFNYPECIQLSKLISKKETAAKLKEVPTSAAAAEKMKMIAQVKMKIQMKKELIAERISTIERALLRPQE